MSTYTIGQAAERSGFSASALRYYEDIGLVRPAGRTTAGYRLYDESTLARLAFIARAKHLGCSLEEVTDLVGIGDGQRCGPVQRRLHDLVIEKVATTQTQLGELTAFATQLQVAAAQLSGEPHMGACGEGCACVTAAAPPATTTTSTTKPAGEPITCTLANEDRLGRLADWDAVLGHARTRTATGEGGLRITFDETVDPGELARLADAEQQCCAFFSFAITISPDEVSLEVRAPDGATDIVTAVFGSAARADAPLMGSRP